MKNQLIVWSIACSLLYLSACQKTVAPSPDYYPLSIGNYWVYEIQVVDSNGVLLNTYQGDSVVIVNDTLINNQTYYKQQRYSDTFLFSEEWLRYANGELQTATGRICFSTQNMWHDTTFIGHSANYVTTHVNHPLALPQTPQPVTVPAGLFQTTHQQATVTRHDNNNNTTSPLPPIDNYYADRIGLVLTKCYFIYTHPNRKVRIRLINYNV